MRLLTFATCVAALLCGCGGDANDGTDADLPDMDASRGPDASSAADSGGAVLDAASVIDGGRPSDAGGVADAGRSGDAGGAADAAAFADGGAPEDASGPRIDPGPVQCRDSGDCGGASATCNRSAPGGICLGCGNDTDCPDGTECFVASCVRTDCETDLDCNAGFTCSSVTGRCRQNRSCTDDAECGPYDCDATGVCVRWACPEGTCPGTFVCVDALCVEP